jgi:hypothetical protein
MPQLFKMTRGAASPTFGTHRWQSQRVTDTVGETDYMSGEAPELKLADVRTHSTANRRPQTPPRPPEFHSTETPPMLRGPEPGLGVRLVTASRGAPASGRRPVGPRVPKVPRDVRNPLGGNMSDVPAQHRSSGTRFALARGLENRPAGSKTSCGDLPLGGGTVNARPRH